MLQIIDLSNNKFCGKLPGRYIKKFVAMYNMNESGVGRLEFMKDPYNPYSMVLTLNGLQQNYKKLIVTISIFELSNNFTMNIEAIWVHHHEYCCWIITTFEGLIGV